MEKNEIKKLLYKQKPKAWFTNARKDGLLYQAILIESVTSDVWDSTDTVEVSTRGISFLIPLQEIGEVVWEKEVDAKLLIRWLQ